MVELSSLLQYLFDRLEKLPRSISFSLFIISFVAGFRLLGEWLILKGQSFFAFSVLPHHFAFYLAMFVINVNNMSLLLKKPWKHFYGIAGIGVLLGILPVFIDAMIINAATQRYVYLTGFHLFLFDEKTLPLGESIALWVWIFSFSAYIFIASKSWSKTVLGFIITYICVQLVGYVSTVLRMYFLSWTMLKVPGDFYWTMWWLLISFALVCLANPSQVKHAFFRIHHAVIWGVMVLLGTKLVGYIDNISLVRAFIMSFSFFLIMLVNDYFDKETDSVNKRESAISEDTLLFMLYCHLVLVLTSGELGLAMGISAFLFFLLGAAYNCPMVIRLKRNFIMGSLVEGCGAFLCLIAGATQFGPPMNRLFFPVALLFSAGFMIASNMKDYKDFKGDLQCDIETVYVYLYKKGWPVAKTNLLVSIILTVILVLASVLQIFLGVGTFQILTGCLLAVVPGIFMIKWPPRIAVGTSLIFVEIYFIYLMYMVPKLPV